MKNISHMARLGIFLLLIFCYSHARFQTLSTSLTACYAFDNSGAEPISNLTATLGAVTSTVNRFNSANTAYYFSGSAPSNIQLPNDPLLKPTSELSVSFWVKPTIIPSGVGSYILFAKNTVSSNFEAYALTVYNFGGGVSRFGLHKGTGGSTSVCISTSTIVINSWYHLAATVDNSSLKIYINGVLENTVSTTLSFSYDANKTVVFGGSNESYNLPFTGTIDNARFYNRILSATEINSLFVNDPTCVPTLTTTPPTLANFTAPDTVCVGQTFTLQNISTGSVNSNYWSACNSTLVASTQTSNTGALTGLSNPVFMSLNKDGSNHYMFVSNNNPGTLTRLSYGTSYNNTPTVTNLGNFGGAYPINGEGIWIEKEGSTWYGIAVGGPNGSDRISRLNFGGSLANTPTVTNMGNLGAMNYPHRIQIFRAGGNVYGFTTNRSNNTITRFDFGSSLANTPTGVNIGNVGNLSAPNDFSFINVAGNWYAFICNDNNGTLTRLDFGNSLLNSPVGTNIGNAGGLSVPRAIALWLDCSGLKGLIHEGTSNTELNLNFTSGPTGPVTLTSLGNTANYNFPHSMERIRIGDSLTTFVLNASSNSISRSDYPVCNSIVSSTLQNPTMTFTAPGNYTISLTCNQGQYDQSAFCKVIHIQATPIITVSPNPGALCIGATATLSAFGAQVYTWQPGNLTGASVNVNPIVSTNYTVFGNTTAGCSSTSTLNLVVSPSIIVNAVANPPSVCPGNSSTLIANGASSYTWNPGGISGNSIVVNPLSAMVYTVTGETGGCFATATVAINMGQILTLSSTGNLCNNTNVDLSVSPTSSATTIAWTGPGIVGANTTSTITVNVGGIYSVAVNNTITGCNGTGTINVFSNSNLFTLDITPSSSVTCYPGPAVNMLVSAPANLLWFPAAEVTPNTGPLVSVSPSVTSTYTVIGTLGNCTSSAAITISVNLTPTLVLSASQLTVCSLNSVSVTAGGASDYLWMPGNLSGDTVSLVPYSSTIFSVTGANGNCATTQTVLVSVLPVPSLSSIANPANICIGNNSNLSAFGALSYTWQSTGSSSIAPSIIVSPTLSTTYSVSGTNSLGCSATATLLLTVINSPAISATASDTEICAGESVTLTAGGSTSYTWSPGFLIGTTVITTPTVSTNYTVNSNNTTCSYATLFIDVVNCINNSLGLTNAATTPEPSASNYYKIRFTITLGNSSSTELTQLSLKDELKATFPAPTSFTLLSKPKITSANSLLSLNPNFNGGSEPDLLLPATSSLIANKRDTISFELLLEPNGFSGIAKNSVLGLAIDKNAIVLRDSSNNGFSWDPDSDGNPTNNNEVTPIQIDPLEFFIPEGFSPNNDGTNDRFMISGLNGKTISLLIYNRWGNKVYVNGNYDNSWEGTANVGGTLGKGKLPQGTYYYIIEFLGGNGESINGFVVLEY
jgi:gliding motility-associated-like protein